MIECIYQVLNENFIAISKMMFSLFSGVTSVDVLILNYEGVFFSNVIFPLESVSNMEFIIVSFIFELRMLKSNYADGSK